MRNLLPGPAVAAAALHAVANKGGVCNSTQMALQPVLPAYNVPVSVHVGNPSIGVLSQC